MSAGQQPPAGAGADTDLLLRMRKATRRAHHVANALILSKLVVVLTDQKLYAHALATFLPVYEQLEALQARHKDVPGLDGVIAAVAAIPSRAAAMRADLQHLLGPDWAREVQPSPAAQAYAAHLQRLSDEDPVLLLAYVYSMQIPILLGFLGACGAHLKRRGAVWTWAVSLPAIGCSARRGWSMLDAGAVPACFDHRAAHPAHTAAARHAGARLFHGERHRA
jgi:hypothetical protein